jgi:hypothetical protein
MLTAIASHTAPENLWRSTICSIPRKASGSQTAEARAGGNEKAAWMIASENMKVLEAAIAPTRSNPMRRVVNARDTEVEHDHHLDRVMDRRQQVREVERVEHPSHQAVGDARP